MNQVWEIVLQAGQEEVEQKRLRFIAAKEVSPYRELATELLNLHTVEEGASEEKRTKEGELPVYPIEVNPLYRFAAVFGRILDINVTKLRQSRAAFVDLCLHYTARADLREGMTRREFTLRLLEQDIVNGRFGQAAKERYRLFSAAEKDVLITGLQRLCRTGDGLYLFRQSVSAVYPRAMIYESTDRAGELLVYLGRKKTETERERIKLLMDLFLPMQTEVHLFYEYHFGIIGVDETMVQDQMVLF